MKILGNDIRWLEPERVGCHFRADVIAGRGDEHNGAYHHAGHAQAKRATGDRGEIFPSARHDKHNVGGEDRQNQLD